MLLSICLIFHFVLGTKEQTSHFIKMRGENDHLFTGAKHSATTAWRYNNIISSQHLSTFINPYPIQNQFSRYQYCPSLVDMSTTYF